MGFITQDMRQSPRTEVVHIQLVSDPQLQLATFSLSIIHMSPEADCTKLQNCNT